MDISTASETKGAPVDVLALMTCAARGHDHAPGFAADLREARDAVAELIVKGNRTIAAFEAMGKAVGVAKQLSARTECESSLVALKDVLTHVGGAL